MESIIKFYSNMWFLNNAVTRKNLMALTGLFLSFFLVIHLIGNLQLLYPTEQAQHAYNWYSDLLAGNIVIKIISYILYTCIILHALDGIYLAFKSKKAKGDGIVKRGRTRSSSWYSQNMTVLGLIILIFLVIHFKDFWYQYKFGDVPLDENGYRDLYSLVVVAFSQLWYVIFYVISIIALGYHLLHGVFSAYRTIGLYNPFYSKVIKVLGAVFAIGISIGYIIIPLYIYLNQ